MTIGENIKKYRKVKNITQSDLGALIGKCESTIRKYELNVVKPPIDIINKIAGILECPPLLLIDPVNIIDEDYIKIPCVRYNELLEIKRKYNKLLEVINE